MYCSKSGGGMYCSFFSAEFIHGCFVRCSAPQGSAVYFSKASTKQGALVSIKYHQFHKNVSPGDSVGCASIASASQQYMKYGFQVLNITHLDGTSISGSPGKAASIAVWGKTEVQFNYIHFDNVENAYLCSVICSATMTVDLKSAFIHNVYNPQNVPLFWFEKARIGDQPSWLFFNVPNSPILCMLDGKAATLVNNNWFPTEGFSYIPRSCVVWISVTDEPTSKSPTLIPIPSPTRTSATNEPTLKSPTLNPTPSIIWTSPTDEPILISSELIPTSHLYTPPLDFVYRMNRRFFTIAGIIYAYYV